LELYSSWVEVGSVVDVTATPDFEALKAAVVSLEARLTVVEENVKIMPAEIKTQFLAVLEWMKANV